MTDDHPVAPAPAPDLTSPADGRADERGLLGWVALIAAVAALALGVFAVARSDDAGEAAAVAGPAAGAPTVIDVDLGSMEMIPDVLTAPPGPVQLNVTNVDAAVHNLTVMGMTTADLQPGESEVLDLGVLDAGVYEFWCDIPGHREAGMTGELRVESGATAGGEEGDHAAGGGESDHLHGFEDWESMDAAMNERALRFVEEDKGDFGGQTLEPTILPDGTKEFELYAEIVEWEVEPGVVVEAWTYNGMVPGPHLHLEVGDRGRFVFENRLPVATSIHWHGVDVPNPEDGVPPYTQPSIAPGETYVYEFEATREAVGIWHSHSGAEQVLDGLFAAITIGQMDTPEVLVEQGFAEVPDQTINMVLNDAGEIGLTLNGKSFPATEAYTAEVGDTIMVHYYNEGLMSHPMHLHQPVGWVIARDGVELITPWAGDTFNIAPGERWTVLYKVERPGVWAWHCHILTHAERADGMFGMVTALIVPEPE